MKNIKTFKSFEMSEKKFEDINHEDNNTEQVPFLKWTRVPHSSDHRNLMSNFVFHILYILILCLGSFQITLNVSYLYIFRSKNTFL
jgi:hypothetical protein